MPLTSRNEKAGARRLTLKLVTGAALIAAASFGGLNFYKSATSDEKAPRPKYGATATRLSEDRGYVVQKQAADFWALMPYYTHQQTGSACSVASVAMVLNGLRAAQKLPASEPLITQDSLLDKVGDKKWKRATGPKGGGVTLDELGQLTLKALRAYGMKDARVEVVQAADTDSFREKFDAALSANEKSASDFMIVNFLQSKLTGDPEGAVGHIAPVAGYDNLHKKVLIFDPDRQWYEPYWVSQKTIVDGMLTKDETSGKMRGFVWVKAE